MYLHNFLTLECFRVMRTLPYHPEVGEGGVAGEEVPGARVPPELRLPCWIKPSPLLSVPAPHLPQMPTQLELRLGGVDVDEGVEEGVVEVEVAGVQVVVEVHPRKEDL